ncbi:MAG: hemolysin family protein [Clostridia bacterium]|nr:hemolysin family protein [Clostridia bacterium]
MDDIGISKILFGFVSVFLLVFLNGFFVAAEFSLVKVRASRLTQLVNEGSHRARYAQHVASKLDAYLSACQLGITLASLGLGWLGEPIVAKMIDPILKFFGAPDVAVHTISFSIAFAFITILHIVLGELAPKSFAIQKTETAALWLSLPLMFFYKITYPAIWILNHLSNFILKMIGLEPASELEHAHTEEEIRILVNESQKSGFIDQTESTLFDNVFQFSDMIAREAMVPRTNVVVLYTDVPFEEIMETVKESRHTRYPVAEEDKDYIIGYVHITDLYAEYEKKGEKNLKDIVRKILTVPESMELSHVLSLMQKNKIQIAVVADEYGGTAGLLTMADVLEEIVGELQDEFDDKRPEIEKIDDGYSIDGLLLIEDVNDLLGTNISNEDVDTIGGWMHTILEDNPEVGESVTWENIIFKITEVERNRIARILVIINPEVTNEVEQEG